MFRIAVEDFFQSSPVPLGLDVELYQPSTPSLHRVLSSQYPVGQLQCSSTKPMLQKQFLAGHASAILEAEISEYLPLARPRTRAAYLYSTCKKPEELPISVCSIKELTSHLFQDGQVVLRIVFCLKPVSHTICLVGYKIAFRTVAHSIE